jgi:hypothetical protein
MNLIILRELSLTNTFRQGDNLDFFYQSQTQNRSTFVLPTRHSYYKVDRDWRSGREL